MDRTYQKFLRSGIDLAPIGVERREDNTPYFCTTKGASIFGWAGVDGIHFCFIRGFGSMVFAVSPMNSAPNYVHPVALNYADFLRLLLACGDAAVLEQAWMWDEAQFDAFLQENPVTQEQRECLSEVAERMGLTPMECPWSYLKELQASFDYSRIKYTEEYYETVAEWTHQKWKVYFEGGFWHRHGRDHAGTEIRLDRQLEWAGYHWSIPAVYSCGKGLVVDICMRVEAEEIRKFMKKWNLTPENDSCENFTYEQQLQIDSENPLCFDLAPQIELNGKILPFSQGSAISFNPCLPEETADEAKSVIEHYGLDSSYGWMIYRNSFPWAGKRRTPIQSLSITMEQSPQRVIGARFRLHAPGDSVTFAHPVSGMEYTLTVQELEQQSISTEHFDTKHWIYPTHITIMSYTISPEPGENFMIRDCAEGDKLIEKVSGTEPFAPETGNHVVSTGIIGGRDGPVAVMAVSTSQDKYHVAASSLHFEPVKEDIEWCAEFFISQFENGQFSLM